MASGSLLPSIDHLDNKVDKNVLYYSYEWYKEFYNLYSELGAKLFVQLRSAHVLHPYTSLHPGGCCLFGPWYYRTMF